MDVLRMLGWKKNRSEMIVCRGFSKMEMKKGEGIRLMGLKVEG